MRLTVPEALPSIRSVSWLNDDGICDRRIGDGYSSNVEIGRHDGRAARRQHDPLDWCQLLGLTASCQSGAAVADENRQHEQGDRWSLCHRTTSSSVRLAARIASTL